MTVLTADQTGTPAVEAPSGDCGGMRPGKQKQVWYTTLVLGIAAVAFLVAWRLHGGTPSTYRIDNQWSAFTGLFILALAIERAIAPFSRKLGPDTSLACGCCRPVIFPMTVKATRCTRRQP